MAHRELLGHWFSRRHSGLIALAEDGDPVFAAAGDADFVEMVVDPFAVHFELAEHLPGMADGGVGPASDGVLGRFVALGEVVGRAAVEAVSLALIPNPTSLVVVREVRRSGSAQLS